jgi:hypothetical protein
MNTQILNKKGQICIKKEQMTRVEWSDFKQISSVFEICQETLLLKVAKPISSGILCD